MRSSREDTLDLRVPPKEEKLLAVEAQTHRRFIKTHLPVDALVYSPGAKYIFVGVTDAMSLGVSITTGKKPTRPFMTH